MANTVAKAFVEQFKSNVVHLAQQRGSRLRDKVRVEQVVGKQHNFERIGTSAAVAKTTQHTATPVVDVPHSRRVCSMTDWHWADLIDQEDKIRMLINPQSEYTKTAAWAMGRKWDDLIIAAMSGNSVDGDGANVGLPAAQEIAHGSAGITVAKILSAREILLANDVDEENDTMYFAVSAEELTALLNITEVKSADYNTIKALAKGDVSDFCGFKFVRTQQLSTITGSPNTRACLAWAQSGVGLAVGADVSTRIDDRSDKSYATQVYLAFTAGSIRIEEEKVVEITVTRA